MMQFGLVSLDTGLTWKGPYDNTTAYVLNDAVLGADGNSYKAIASTTGNAPPNASFWALLPPMPLESIQAIMVELVDSKGKTVVNWSYSLGAAQTSGTLVINTKYLITEYHSPDDFMNVGAAANLLGQAFKATGTNPTAWAALSKLQKMNESAGLLLSLGMLQMELLGADTAKLNGTYEVRIKLSVTDPMYIVTGAQTDVLCLPDVLKVTPC